MIARQYNVQENLYFELDHEPAIIIDLYCYFLVFQVLVIRPVDLEQESFFRQARLLVGCCVTACFNRVFIHILLNEGSYFKAYGLSGIPKLFESAWRLFSILQVPQIAKNK